MIAMQNRLALKLGQFVRLSAADLAILDTVVQTAPRSVPPRTDIIREGDKPEHVNLILEGWACRYKLLQDGRRQVVGFFLPGDICDRNVAMLRRMDHSIGSITAVTYAQLPASLVEELSFDSHRLVTAFRWETLVNSAIQREWTVNLGQRSAFERIAHLFCELICRLRAVGLSDRDRCELPITQADLADATGMTPVHVNRIVQELRARGLIQWRGSDLRVPDFAALADAGLFNPNYLHARREGMPTDAEGGW